MKKITRSIILLFISLQTFGQYSTLGTDFWVTWMQNFYSPENCIVYITSGVGATGTISMPGSGWSQNFTVAANGAYTVTIPSAQAPCISTCNTVLNKAVRITSNNPIAAYTVNQRDASTDATLILPVAALGDDYMVTTYTPFSANPSEFIVVGTAANTSIQIIPKAALIGGVSANVPFNITLNAGQVYLVQSNGDLTGSIVKATNANQCNNFAVFAGNKCANVSTACFYCDHLFEQMIPLKAWGNKFVTSPLLTRTGDVFRVLAAENGTTIHVNGGAGINLNAGQFHEVFLSPASYISSNKPISVAQYSRGQSCDNASSDPFMIMLSPVEQFMDHIVFFSFQAGYVTTLATNIITKTANTGLATLDGAPITGWATVPSNNTYSHARKTVSQGSHTLHSDSGLVAIVYGWGNVESYGYLAGANVQPLNVGFAIIVDNDTIPYDVFQDTLGCNQQTVTFMTDPNAPISDITWDFGDGTTGQNSPITHTFPGTGTYDVMLHYIRIGSCVMDSLILQVHINSSLPPVIFSNDTTFCDLNSTLLLDATIPNAATYIWNIPNTGPTYTVTTAGTYSVTATDNNGCIATASVTVDYVNLTLTSTSTNETCMGMNDGTATVTASGGNIPYSYLWNTNPAASTSTASNLPAGTYTVTVTENNGCSATTSVTVSAGGILDITKDSTAVSCFGDADGSATINVTGGASPYTYAWSTNPPQTTQTATGLTAGTYTITITDDNGCAGLTTIIIDTPTELIASIPTVSPAACSNVTGSMTAECLGGTPPYSYSWNTSPAQSGITASGLPAGIYTVTVTDNNGCTATASAEYTTISLSFTHEPEYCDQQNGEASVYVDQHTGNYTITWSNSSTSPTITGLSGGTYTVTVTDDNGLCTMSVQVPEIQGPLASFTMEPNPATMGEDVVSFHNQSIGGNQWNWDFGDYNSSFDENPKHTYYNFGTYTVWLVVTDEHNCSDSISNNILIHNVFTFYVPNAFSPNGDGINDVFMPYGMNSQPDNYSMTIFDRWGGILFYTTNMNTPWDGKVDGKIDTEHINVYAYKITFRDSRGIDRELSGIVTLVY